MGVHPKLVAAMAYEQAGMRVQPEFENLDMSSQEAIRMTQGGVHSTYSWNALIGYIMQLMLPGWFSNKFGVELNDSFITHAVWSDNIWLFAKSVDELKQMVRPLTLMLKHYGLEWKDKSLKVPRGRAHFHELPEDNFVVQCAADEPQSGL